MADDKTKISKEGLPKTYTFEDVFLEKFAALGISMPLSAWARYQLYKGLDEESRKLGKAAPLPVEAQHG